MATDEKNKVFVELHDLAITDRPDDRFGRVLTAKSLDENDLIRTAVARGTDLSPVTLRAALDILKGLAREELANGASINFGLGYFSLEVRGVFTGDHPRWDPALHALAVHVTPTAEVRNTIRNVAVEVRGMASSGIVINSVTDVTTGEVNTRLTPGGGLNILGSKIKVTGESEDVGISFLNENTHDETPLPLTSILLNDPSKISCIVPSTLEAGDYKLRITTQFSSTSHNLKEPRSYVFDYILQVFGGGGGGGGEDGSAEQ